MKLNGDSNGLKTINHTNDWNNIIDKQIVNEILKSYFQKKVSRSSKQ